MADGGDMTNRISDQVYKNEKPIHIDSRRAALYDLPKSRREEKPSSSLLMQSVLTNS
jgi:hypothetical protein